MEDTMRATIETLMSKVEAKSKELAELRRTINFLMRETGGEPVYADEALSSDSFGTAGIRPDQFYGKSPVTAAREYLEGRNRAVHAEEITDALERGGFDFQAQGWKKADRLRSLAISLSKNSMIFHRLPNGTYGLVKFYPDIQERKSKPATTNGQAPPADADSAAPTGRDDKKAGGEKTPEEKKAS